MYRHCIVWCAIFRKHSFSIGRKPVSCYPPLTSGDCVTVPKARTTSTLTLKCWPSTFEFQSFISFTKGTRKFLIHSEDLSLGTQPLITAFPSSFRGLSLFKRGGGGEKALTSVLVWEEESYGMGSRWTILVPRIHRPSSSRRKLQLCRGMVNV